MMAELLPFFLQEMNKIKTADRMANSTPFSRLEGVNRIK